MRTIAFCGFVALMALLVAPGLARSQTYSFNVPAKLTNIAFESRMEVEDIFGTSNRVNGWLKAGAKPTSWTFRFEVPVDSLKTGIAMRDDHLRSAQWLNATKHPAILFEGKSVRKVGKDRYKVRGTFTLRGKSRPLTVTVTARAIPAAKAKRLGLAQTDWVRLRGSFDLRLSDFGVTIPKMAAAKVNDRWTVKISLFGKREG